MGFKSSVADLDVWRRPATKLDGKNYYEYIMIYVDDVVCISENAKDILGGIADGKIKIKNDKVAPPEVYLGAEFQFKVMDDTGCWTISSEDYVGVAINNVKEILKGYHIIN